jgi:hypothetical protein
MSSYSVRPFLFFLAPLWRRASATVQKRRNKNVPSDIPDASSSVIDGAADAVGSAPAPVLPPSAASGSRGWSGGVELSRSFQPVSYSLGASTFNLPFPSSEGWGFSGYNTSESPKASVPTPSTPSGERSAADVASILSADMQGVMMEKLGLVTPDQAAKVNRVKDFFHLIDERIKAGGLSEAQAAFLEKKNLLKDGKAQNMNGFMFGIKNLEETIAEFGFDVRDFGDIQTISRSGAQAPAHIPPSGVLIKWAISDMPQAKELEKASLILQQAGRGLDGVLRMAKGQHNPDLAKKYDQFGWMNRAKDGPELNDVQKVHQFVNSMEQSPSMRSMSYQYGLPGIVKDYVEKLVAGYDHAQTKLDIVLGASQDEGSRAKIQKLRDQVAQVQAHYLNQIRDIDPGFVRRFESKALLSTPEFI